MPLLLAIALLAAPAAQSASAEDMAFMENLLLDAPEAGLRLCRNMPLIGLHCVGFDNVEKQNGELTYTHYLTGPVTRNLRPGRIGALSADYHSEAEGEAVVFTYQPPARAVKRYKRFLRVTLAYERVYRRDPDGRLRLSSERSVEWFLPLDAEPALRGLAAAARMAGQTAVADAVHFLGLDE